MNNFELCIKYRPCTDCVIISCRLGLWSVQGDYSKQTVKLAEEKYKHFRDLGKYKNLIKENANGAVKTKWLK